MTTHLSLTPAFMEAATSSSSSPPLPLLPFSSHSDSAHLSPFQNLKPSILVIVLILFITFLLSLSLCLLLRHLNRRCLRHLSPSSHVSSTTSSSSNRQTAARSRVSPENPELFSLIDSFPMFTYASIKRRSTNSSGDCAVCLSKFEQQDQLRLLPLCCHAFHVTCIDTWLESNQTCPLCRSHIHASESEVLKALSSTIDSGGTDSFRLEIGSISHRQMASEVGLERRNSYSVGSFEYVVDEESEITMNRTHRRSISDKEIEAQVSQSTQESTLASEVGAGRSWLKDYVDRLSASLSSRALSFRSSGRFFTGSSRRTEIGSIGDYDVEANRMGDEISEMFRWFAGA